MRPDPATPPPEVLDALAVAAAEWRRLAGEGRSVRFALDPTTHEVAVRLVGPAAIAISLTGAEALALADGRRQA